MRTRDMDPKEKAKKERAVLSFMKYWTLTSDADLNDAVVARRCGVTEKFAKDLRKESLDKINRWEREAE